jgi:TPP-dependent pyruvate/acetoin dehydrogenase alpha subunit
MAGLAGRPTPDTHLISLLLEAPGANSTFFASRIFPHCETFFSFWLRSTMSEEGQSLAESSSNLKSLDRTEALALYKAMVDIRLFEDGVHALFMRNLVRGSTHLCQGQEAVSVGACSVLMPRDTMTCTYRGHGAVLAMGAPLDRAFGEILGKAEGMCAGRGGSMHLADVSVGALGSFAIVGAHLPFSCGSALAAQVKGTGAITLCFFGDATMNIGAFHEALNLAAIWKLPVVFMCENNLYGEYSPLKLTTPIARLADRASAYGIPGEQVDGNDVMAIRTAVSQAAGRARAGDGPTLLEALTYRHKGHSRTDPATYRPEGELEQWLERDPLLVFQQFLTGQRLVASDEIDQVQRQAATDVAEALDRAMHWPDPEPEDLFNAVYAP